MNFAELQDYYFNQMADSRTSKWLLMATPLPVIIISIVYLVFVTKIGPWYMKDRKPFVLKSILQAYNLFQVICCCLLIYGVLTHGWLTKLSVFKCHPVDYSDDPDAVGLARYTWWTFMLKICELIETIFFVLRKKYNQVSKLHLYHHISTMNLAWIGTKYIAGGMATFPILLNSFIHVIMYIYYFLSTWGPKWQKRVGKWKSKITMMQMIQFCILIAHSSMALAPNCPVPKKAVLMFIPNVVLVFYMFYEFYQKSYTKKPAQQQQKSKKVD